MSKTISINIKDIKDYISKNIKEYFISSFSKDFISLGKEIQFLKSFSNLVEDLKNGKTTFQIDYNSYHLKPFLTEEGYIRFPESMQYMDEEDDSLMSLFRDVFQNAFFPNLNKSIVFHYKENLKAFYKVLSLYTDNKDFHKLANGRVNPVYQSFLLKDNFGFNFTNQGMLKKITVQEDGKGLDLSYNFFDELAILKISKEDFENPIVKNGFLYILEKQEENVDNWGIFDFEKNYKTAIKNSKENFVIQRNLFGFSQAMGNTMTKFPIEAVYKPLVMFFSNFLLKEFLIKNNPDISFLYKTEDEIKNILLSFFNNSNSLIDLVDKKTDTAIQEIK